MACLASSLCFLLVEFICRSASMFFSFFFNDTATTEIYTLSLHDALPISTRGRTSSCPRPRPCRRSWRSEEHTSELQSRRDLVCRLLLEKKKKRNAMNFAKTKKKTIQKEAHTEEIQ